MKLINKIVFLGALFSFYANAAQVNISGNNYTYNAVNWQKDDGALLTAAILHDRLVRVRGGSNVDCVRELARMLLAQIPVLAAQGREGGVVNHNVVANNNPGYVQADLVGVAGARNSSDIYRNCTELKEHMLFHGHLGYYPCLSFTPGRSPCAVNQLSARGIFNIPFQVANRITNFQKDMLTGFLNNKPNYFALPNTRAYPHGYNINADTFHLLPNVVAGVMFGIDPAVTMGDNPNLNDVTNGLINNLLSTDNITAVVVGDVNRNRFTLDVTYDFQNPIHNVTQTQDVGYNLTGESTNTVKIVVEVTNGFVSIVTMYPI